MRIRDQGKADLAVQIRTDGAPVPETPAVPAEPVAQPAPVDLPASIAADPPRGSGGPFDGLRPLVTLLGNVTVLSALLFFFGWRQTATQDADLGLAQDVFGLGTQDYLLRSVGPVVRLLAVLGVLGLGLAYLDRSLRWVVRVRGANARVVRSCLRVLDVAWLAVPLMVYLLRRLRPESANLYIAYPLALGLGVLLIVYRTQLRRAIGLGAPRGAPGRDGLERGAVALLLAVAVFWATSNYADVEGRRLATAFRASDLQQVTVFSPHRLDLTGAQEQIITGTGADYRYRYTGLRLMAHSGGHYFLVPVNWTASSGVLVVLADSDPVRLEFGNAT
ncbi:MAG: hypothetical protein QOJ62_1681 [Actinomycetota bacterium]|nr:hypothetical protein [Actinomycetota bacterium]